MQGDVTWHHEKICQEICCFFIRVQQLRDRPHSPATPGKVGVCYPKDCCPESKDFAQQFEVWFQSQTGSASLLATVAGSFQVTIPYRKKWHRLASCPWPTDHLWLVGTSAMCTFLWKQANINLAKLRSQQTSTPTNQPTGTAAAKRQVTGWNPRCSEHSDWPQWTKAAETIEAVTKFLSKKLINMEPLNSNSISSILPLQTFTENDLLFLLASPMQSPWLQPALVESEHLVMLPMRVRSKQ